MADHSDVKDARVELQLQWANLRKELVDLLARKEQGWGEAMVSSQLFGLLKAWIFTT